MLCALAQREGASEAVDQLPKYKFQRLGNFQKVNGEIKTSLGGIMMECDTDHPQSMLFPMRMLNAAYAFLPVKMKLNCMNFPVATISIVLV